MRLLVLEATATFASTRERLLAGSVGERVLILTQPDQVLANRDVLLVLLRRLADREHLEVGLVSDDHGLRRQAAALGLPAFPDIQSAERQERAWHVARRREQVGFRPGQAHGPATVAKP